jgi:uncharacterized repeat protein (TIGR03803 family)
MTPSGTLTTLHSFGAGNGFGHPEAGLIRASDGLFYGTTQNGGANRQGSIFKITSSGTFTQIHAFDGNDGAEPVAPLLQASDGNFHGTASMGGTNGGGVIFEVDSAGNFNALVNLPAGARSDAGLIQLDDGRLYGTIARGGTNGLGAIFKVNPSNGNYTQLFSFSGSDGSLPVAGLVQGADGMLYGTTVNGGGADIGVVFLLCTRCHCSP